MQTKQDSHPMRLAFLLSTVLLPTLGLASPAQILEHSVDKKLGPEGEQIITLTISGAAFGNKPQPAPVLWVFGDDVRENGKQASATPYNFGNQVGNAGPNIWEYVDPNVVYSDKTRYPALESSYFVARNGTVRGPLAYGGTSNPPYSDAVYLSARIKPVAAWHSFSSPGYTNLSGNFDTGPSRYEPGESITISNAGKTASGKIININRDLGRVTIQAEGMYKSDLQGANVVGKDTGASMVLDTDTYYSSAVGSKYFRMWSGGLTGLYSVLTTNRLIVRYADQYGETVAEAATEDGEVDVGYGIPDMTSKLDWRLMEVVASQRGDTAYSYIDVDNQSRRVVGNLDLANINKFTDRSPTISQLGLDAAGGTEMIDAALYFGEIYFDNTPQRIMLSENDTYDKSGSDLELQYPISWSDSEITFELRAGELDLNKDIFVYVFDEESSPNQRGYRVCIDCMLSAPAPVELRVE